MDQRVTGKRHWEQVSATQVTFGNFAMGELTQAFFDSKGPSGPILYVSGNACAEDKDLLRLSWYLIGPGHREAFEAFDVELGSGRREEFFRRKGMGDAEWDELDAVIGIGGEQMKQRLKPIAFAAWKRYATGDPGSFEEAWRKLNLTAAEVAAWFKLEDALASRFLVEARHAFGDEQQLALLGHVGLSVQDWQEARHTLGLAVFKFRQIEECSLRALKRLLTKVAPATTKALNARRAFGYPSHWADLWREFPELGSPDFGGESPRPQPMFFGVCAPVLKGLDTSVRAL